MTNKTIELSPELYESFQKIKTIFSDMVGKPIEKDEDVLSILLDGFIDSLVEGEANHGHSHGEDGCGECDCEDGECKNSKDGDSCCGGSCGC
ncbi:MAG TPA: hypothetical protein PKD96_00580 [Candidatus Absconditabacterales bacterium]|nr:hypothetical protein [Candidatus Absconditabacterales bacterium]HMT26776.1 hypothetical protein [Candidatus Absconditabacterales bacterium]